MSITSIKMVSKEPQKRGYGSFASALRINSRVAVTLNCLYNCYQTFELVVLSISLKVFELPGLFLVQYNSLQVGHSFLHAAHPFR
jgi:hypothetical protein